MSKSAGVMLGQASPWADQFVQSVQNPFEATAKGILDPLTKARASGTLKYDDVTAAQTRFDDAVAALRDTQKSFEGLGTGQATVVKQSNKQLDPFIENIKNQLTDHLGAAPKPEASPDAALPPVSDTPPNTSTILTAEGTTPAIKAVGAALQARKRAMGGGRQSTILTSSVGVAARPKQAGKSLLGF